MSGDTSAFIEWDPREFNSQADHGGGGESAAGLILRVLYDDGTEAMLCRAGRILGVLESAFDAELLATEWALEYFTATMCVDARIM